MEDSIFTKIIKGEIPSHKIYEDEKTLAFLDIFPIQEGMVVVIPKVQVDAFMDLEDEDYAALMQTVKIVARKMKSVYPTKRIGVVIEGFEVPHTHVKLIPISSGKDLKAPQPTGDPDHAALAEVANRLLVSD